MPVLEEDQTVVVVLLLQFTLCVQQGGHRHGQSSNDLSTVIHHEVATKTALTVLTYVGESFCSRPGLLLFVLPLVGSIGHMGFFIWGLKVKDMAGVLSQPSPQTHATIASVHGLMAEGYC